MIFVDTNVFMYAAGSPHPLRQSAVEFFVDARRNHVQLVTSAEVVQELLHVYVSVGRLQRLGAAMSLVDGSGIEIWPLEADDVTLAWQLHEEYPYLSARDLCHLASCRRRGVRDVMTFDQSLRGAFTNIL